MKEIVVALFFVFSYPVFGQTTFQTHIFNDTSRYFIDHPPGEKPVDLSPDELALAEQLLLQAIEEYSLRNQRYEDSVHPKKKKGEYVSYRIVNLNADDYKFGLIPSVDSSNQKVIWIAGNCNRRFNPR